MIYYKNRIVYGVLICCALGASCKSKPTVLSSYRLQPVKQRVKVAPLPFRRVSTGKQAGRSVTSKKVELPLFNFESEIQKLRERADYTRGITWTLSGDTLFRDADKACGLNLYAAEDYMVQILNIFRAAKKIYVLYGQDERVFVEKATQAMEVYRQSSDTLRPEMFWEDYVKTVNTDVVSALQKEIFPSEGVKYINQKLRLAENYVGLDDKHYNVTTTFRIAGKRFGLEAKRCFTLTPAQQLQFKYRKTTGWYDCLDDFEKKIIDCQVDKILDGAHYLPTQIRLIPGCRNAYQKRVLAYDDKGKAVVLARYYHSATFASFVCDKAISDQIALHNWEQIRVCAQNIKVLSLNNNVHIKGTDLSEQFIVEKTRDLVGVERFMYIPINIPGKLTTAIFKDQVKELLEDSKKNSCLLKDIGVRQVSNDHPYWSNLNALKEAAGHYDIVNKLIHNLKVTDNYYAKIGASYISCKMVLDCHKGQEVPSILFSCKSGKDRTGFMSYLVDGAVIHMTHANISTEEEIYTKMAYAAHAQFLASVNGGMPGRFGLKLVPRDVRTVLGSVAHIWLTNIDKQLFARPATLTKFS